MTENKKKINPALRYSDDFRQRAVDMYRQAIKTATSSHGVRPRIAKELGISDVTLRDWVLKADAKDSTINSLSQKEAADKIKEF